MERKPLWKVFLNITDRIRAVSSKSEPKVSGRNTRALSRQRSLPSTIDLLYNRIKIDSFTQVSANLIGPGFDFQQVDGCDCWLTQDPHLCNSSGACICLQRSGSNSSQSPASPSGPIFECGPNCCCFSFEANCRNILVGEKDRGLGTRFEVIEREESVGLGLITKSSILKDQFVIEYVGEYLDLEEARKRSSQGPSKARNYLLNFCEYFGEESVVWTSIDALSFGNESRFINHSCNPNLLVVPVRSSHQLHPRLCLFANRDIVPEEELSYDYGNSKSSTSLRLCFCSSLNCRKYLPFDII